MLLLLCVLVFKHHGGAGNWTGLDGAIPSSGCNKEREFDIHLSLDRNSSTTKTVAEWHIGDC